MIISYLCCWKCSLSRALDRLNLFAKKYLPKSFSLARLFQDGGIIQLLRVVRKDEGKVQISSVGLDKKGNNLPLFGDNLPSFGNCMKFSA